MTKRTGDLVMSVEPILDRFRLTGKVSVVTGGGSGIGRAVAHAFADAGAHVAIVDIRQDSASRVADEVSSKGGRAVAIDADVTDEDSVRKAFAQVAEKLGQIDILVNNAGMSKWTNAEVQDRAEWDQIMDLNVTGVFLCSKHVTRYMFAAGYGKIINIASMSAHIVNTPQNQAAYNTSKAGVLHLTRSLAVEWARRGVRVNSISPGYTLTPLVEDLLETEIGEQVMPKWMERTPMNAMLNTTDLQGAAVFLASPASDMVTGSDLLIDGGYCAW